MIRLYGAAISRSARCLWALEELGLKYDHIPWPPDWHPTPLGSEETRTRPITSRSTPTGVSPPLMTAG